MANTALLKPAGPGSTPVEEVQRTNRFVRAAEKTRQAFDDQTTQISASSVNKGPIDVAAVGYLRNIVLYVSTDGTGAGGSAAAADDAPWNAITDVKLTDTNGAPLIGPISGYHLYLINKWGAYTHGVYDPAVLPSYTAMDANGEFTFKLRIPVEITSNNGLGSLPNLNSAATFKFHYVVNAEANIYSTAPLTTTPSLRVRCYVEAWSQPHSMDAFGVGNETEPPGMGTAQFWSETNINITAGTQNIRFTKTGNHYRNLIFAFRNDASPSVRISSEFPVDPRIERDNKIVDTWTKVLWEDQMYERFAQSPDTGVYVIDFTHDADGRPGNENRDDWVKTTTATRYEFSGVFTGAGVLTILTNDIAVAGSQPLSSGN